MAGLLAIIRLAAPVPPPLHLAPRILDARTASVEELQLLEGMGASLARRIVAWRRGIGPLESSGDLRRIQGVGPDRLDRWSPFFYWAPERAPGNSILKPPAAAR